MSTATEIPFIERDVQEIFASRCVRIEILSGGLVRWWLAVEEHAADGSVQHMLVVKIITTIEGVMENQQLLTATLAGQPATCRDGMAAPVH